jgi:MOSC domain-containing protein YiiM
VDQIVADGVVVAVSRSRKHTVAKVVVPSIVLRAGFGVEDDAHSGATVQHRYDRQRDPQRPNLRQVHLIGAELFDELLAAGGSAAPGELGENITTRGIDLAALPAGALLQIGPAQLELTGLRHPCALIERIRPGLRNAVTMQRNGTEALRHGVMAIVRAGGEIRPGDRIALTVPNPPHRALPHV